MLEFEEFLKIGGCTHGRHLFAPKSSVSTVRVILLLHLFHLPCLSRGYDWLINRPQTEEFIDCRIDHYQTPATVHVSIFAKQVNKERSAVIFESEKVSLTHELPIMAGSSPPDIPGKLMTYIPLLLSIY